VIRSSLLLVSDLLYPAQGRRYGDEDTWLAGRLRQDFDVAICSPLDATALRTSFDLILVRNSGPVIHYQQAYNSFRDAVIATEAVLVNPPTGRGDQRGKDYLLTLTQAGEAVIPTIDMEGDLRSLPQVPEYVVKPVLGSDSVGLQFVAADQLGDVDLTGCLVQPKVDVRHEISFVFVGRSFSYAIYAPDRDRRWDLTPYDASAQEIELAQRFVDWNTLDVGVQRVDVCRTQDGELLLVELEDLNPYLSLDVLLPPVRESFYSEFTQSLRMALQQR
jgi:hypothetical protein